MKEGCWAECLESDSALQITKNKEKAKSLVKIADGRIKFLEKQKLSKENANYVFEGYYASVLELLQAIVTEAGYKVLNYICLGFFLRDILKKDDLFMAFDNLRYKRNGLVYYGNQMSFEVAADSIEKSKALSRELKKILKLLKSQIN